MTTTPTVTSSAFFRSRRLVRGGAVVAALALVPFAGSMAASAASPTAATAAEVAAPMEAAANTGWIRLGHLSPDTKAVDVRLTALSGGDVLYELDNVTYGAVSPYTAMPAGIYTVSMVPAGSPMGSEATISTSVKITEGASVTVAAYGTNNDLSVQLYNDDLTAPADGKARIRLIQASTVTDTVDVSTSTGIAIADGAVAGSSTNYAEVDAGEWSLNLTGENVADDATVDLATGSVTTLFVLDTAEKGLTILPVLDSAAVGEVPVGSVPTGGGFLADTVNDALLQELLR